MLTKAGYRHALDWLRGVRLGATANGSDLTLAGLIADEIDRLTAEIKALKSTIYGYEQIIDNAAKDGIHISHKQIAAAVEYAESWPLDGNARGDIWAGLNMLGIFRCEECGGNGNDVRGRYSPKHLPGTPICPDCNGRGYTIKSDDATREVKNE